MLCTECGFRLDPVNESQQFCPACGGDPIPCGGADIAAGLTAALADVESLAAQSPLTMHDIKESLPVDSEVDYLPDPELDMIVAEAEAYIKALCEGPILVAGNRMIN